ncbi:hypothetical protein WH50_12470 [Pokkaliibacter plantistimulans]|uniref:Uncharacterized protein n=1 Tax=Pokkaliibacter plantistimulans TaxID=1635171 RepID=A0ABX5LXA9_9GAMM|nr:hypothetical protein [Pokkaliibacter plantistimulans]PXF30931.1 hypothetical protein WH50_12470 [Pokkaliibacter plantistimulans]
MGKKTRSRTQQVLPLLNNLVAKHAETFCKAQTHVDRKKDMKRGKEKNAGRWWPDLMVLVTA